MKKIIQIDTLTTLKPLNRYLALVVVKKYSKKLYFKNKQPYQKIENNKSYYKIRWGFVKSDLKGLFANPFKIAPQIAYSLLAFWFIFQGKHDEALKIAMMGAITLDAVTTGEDTDTVSVTVANNSNRLMLVGYSHYQGGGSLTGATFNSDAMTAVKLQEGEYGETADIWGLVAPDVATANVVLTGAASWDAIGVYSLYNCSQTLPHNVGGDTQSWAWAGVTMTTGHDNSWVICVIECEPVPTIDGSLGGTEDYKLQGESYQNGQGQRKAVATAGEAILGSNLSYGGRWNAAMCEVEVVAEAPATAIKDIISDDGLIPFPR